MNVWRTEKLGNYCSFQEGYVNPSQKNPEYFDGNIKWLRAVDLNDSYVYETTRTLSDAGFKSAGKSALLFEPNTIVISKSGTIGRLGIIKDYMCGNRATINIKPKENADLKYIFFLLLSNRNLIESLAVGSVQKNLYVSVLDNLEFPFPTLEEQKKIGEFLSCLTDKIEVNNKINDNLLQQSRSLYQSWFVDYEPFDGIRPSDWIEDTIDGLAREIICGKTPSTKVAEYYGNDIPFITIPDMHGNTYAITTERYLSLYGAESQKKKTLPRNSICVSCIGTAGLVTLTAQESQTNQQINSIIPKDDYSPYYIYLLMETLSDVINNLGQSGSTIVNLNKAQFSKISVVIPSIASMRSFDEIVGPMFSSILSNQEENLKLAEIRETILPRLMSGELDVSDIDI